MATTLLTSYYIEVRYMRFANSKVSEPFVDRTRESPSFTNTAIHKLKKFVRPY